MRLRDKFEWHFESYKTLFLKRTRFFVGARALDKILCGSAFSRVFSSTRISFGPKLIFSKISFLHVVVSLYDWKTIR